MSFTRFGRGSDVYVFHAMSGGLECCGCNLGNQSFRSTDVEEFITHLEEHTAAGHEIPEWLADELRQTYPDGDTEAPESEHAKERHQALADAVQAIINTHKEQHSG